MKTILILVGIMTLAITIAIDNKFFSPSLTPAITSILGAIFVAAILMVSRQTERMGMV